ncbi:HNH endonuclease [Nocardia tengchongensis]|uniref:HNH endonuclease n=1 Tax=Nocardia tengchongensis TaxID=2055889 RepID=UPI0036A0FA1F
MIVKCIDCPRTFEDRPSGRRGSARKRCIEHATLRQKELVRARDALERAKKWGVPAELVFAREVFERDNWICYLCRAEIPANVRGSRVPGSKHQPFGPVVDHVIPLSAGGPHTLSNVKTAHWTCNAQKHTRTPAFTFAKRVVATDSSPATKRNRPHPTGRLCDLDGCGRPFFSKAFCQLHYNRKRKFGHPLVALCGCGCQALVDVSAEFQGIVYLPGHGIAGPTVTAAEKLRSCIKPQSVSDHGRQRYGLLDDCEIWTGSRNEKGYGKLYLRVEGVKRRGKMMLAHRLAYELAYGAASLEGLTVDHLCGVPLCCNPNHLEAVHLAENLKRAGEKVLVCPQGHPYEGENVVRYASGYRKCRQCTVDRTHIEEYGHSFIADPTGPLKKRRCLTCWQARQAEPNFCPHGHEFTPENTVYSKQGHRKCQQCIYDVNDRDHFELKGHRFVVDPSNSSSKRRRCVVCRNSAAIGPTLF